MERFPTSAIGARHSVSMSPRKTLSLKALSLILAFLATWAAASCRAQEPPSGLELEVPGAAIRAPGEPGFEGLGSERGVSNDSGPSAQNVGQLSDNLPFEPTGEKLGSIAWRAWIYTDTGPQRTRYGYLRAGAVVDRRGPEIKNDGCAEGWYRVNPRGFVCIGKGATLDLNHPVLVASTVRPRRGEGLPYLYAMSRERAPHLFFKLPSRGEMESAEGGYLSRARDWLASVEVHGGAGFIESSPPQWLRDLPTLTRPYGVTRGLHQGAHAGMANPGSAFAISTAFRWEERALGLTTELDVIALDRTRVVRETSFHGVALEPGVELPAGIVQDGWVPRYVLSDNDQLRSDGAYPKRTVLAFSGKVRGKGMQRYFETVDGNWVSRIGLMLVEPREAFPSVATGTRKWIDISLRKQLLVAYVGRKAEYVTLISSGSGGLGDPEEVPATIQGTFMIHAKHVTATMNSEEDVSDSYELRDVPFVQYFHKGFALHAAYWHDDFGRYRSHGCINLAPRDAAWLFEWTDPHVPQHWHAVINKDRGTVVHIHP